MGHAQIEKVISSDGSKGMGRIECTRKGLKGHMKSGVSTRQALIA